MTCVGDLYYLDDLSVDSLDFLSVDRRDDLSADYLDDLFDVAQQ